MTVAGPCPDCGGVLRTRSYEGHRVDVCSGCGAVWFDEGELADLARARGHKALKERSLRHWFASFPAPGEPCPGCASPALRRGTVNSVPLGLCDACGGFLLPVESLAALEVLARKRVHESWLSRADGTDVSFVVEAILDLLATALK